MKKIAAILLAKIGAFAIFFFSASIASAAGCPVTDGGAGDGDASANGTITINANTTWTPTDATTWDCSAYTVHVTNNAVLTFGSNLSSGYYGWLSAANLTIDSGSSISSNEKGCDSSTDGQGSGPDSSNICTNGGNGAGTGFNGSGTKGGGGGGHGGAGGNGSTESGGARFEDIISPLMFGASGGRMSGPAHEGKGGGVVRIDVTTTFTHNGTITANGGAGGTVSTTKGAGGGSGGAIYVNTGTITGTTGTFEASGGAGGNGSEGNANGGGGGGGYIEIAFNTDSLSLGSSDFTVTGGSGPDNAADGNPGQVYVKDKDGSTGTIISAFVFGEDDSSIFSDVSNWTFDAGVVGSCTSGVSTVGVTGVTTLTFGGAWTCSSTSLTTFSLDSTNTFTLTSGTSLTVSQRGAVIDFTLPNDQTWTSFTVTAPGQGNFTIDDAISLTLTDSTIAANVAWTGLSAFSMNSGSSIDADTLGCQALSTTADGYGPDVSNVCTQTTAGYSAGTTGVNAQGTGGAAHGGAGGNGTQVSGGTTTYGSNSAPVLFGSSAGGANGALGGHGGGKIRIDTTGNMTWNGALTADAGAGALSSTNRAGGGGSGGSIYVSAAGTISGTTGTVSADGGAGGDNSTADGGGGGGGRVAITYGTDSTNFIAGLTDTGTVAGATGPGSALDGSTGTLYTAATSTPGPVMTAASTADNDADGQIDRIVITLDKDVDGTSVAGSDFSLSGGYSIASASRTADSQITLVVTESGAGDTGNTPTVTIVGSIQDLSANQTTQGEQASTDGAKPIALSYSYKDTGTPDGAIDRVDITFSENIAYDECESGDFSFGGADAGTIAVASCAASTTDLRLTVNNAPALDTNLALTFTYTAASGTADSLDDAAGNAVTNISGVTLSDGAAPFLRTDGSNSPRYQDNDRNGTVDRVQLVFTETVTIIYADGDWTATVNGLTSFDVSGVTTNSAATIVLTASAAAATTGVNGGTEPTLAFTASGGSISDGTNLLASFSATTVTDAAAPAITNISIEDTGGVPNALIDKLTITWSEYIDTDDGSAPILGDFGTITLPDGQAVTSATISDPADASATVVLTGVAGQVTKNTAVGSTGINGITTEWTDGTNATSNPDDNETITDAAAPFIVSATFKDVTSVDGTIDRVDVVFSENITLSSYDASDWSFPEAGDMSLVDTGASVSGATVLLAVSATSSVTGSAATPTVLYTNNANRLSDGTNNTITFPQGWDIIDGAAPFLRTDGSNAPKFLDNNADGTIDRVQLTFTETTTLTYSDGDWTATANSLTSFDTGAYLSGNGSTQILLTASAQTGLTGVGAAGTLPTLAFTASGGSIVDDVGNDRTSISAVTVNDAASPVVMTKAYKDNDTNGTIDRADLVFSEEIDLDECETSDYTLGGADVGSITISGCATATTTLQLTLSGAPANDTNLALTLAYTATNGIANSLDDSTGNAVATFAALTLSDQAKPILVSFVYQDSNGDGTIDQVVAVFSESVTVTYADGDWTATANSLTGFDVTGLSSGNGTASIVLSATANAGVTGVGGGTQPTLAFAPTTGSIADGSANTSTGISATSLEDDAGMVASAASYKDVNADGQVDRLDVTFSEAPTVGECEAGDYSFGGADAGTIAVSTCATSGNDLRLTLTSAPANDTNITITWSYDSTAGTAGSLEDPLGNAAPNVSALAASDGAAPVKLSQAYKDANADGQVDRADITFSETPAYDECEAGDYTFSGTDAGSIAVSGCAVAGADLRLTLTSAPANDTYLSVSIAYDATTGVANSLDDAAGNAVASFLASALSDGALPVAITKTYSDQDANGQVDRASVTFSESVTVNECEAGDFIFGGADAGTIAVASCTGGSATLALTLANAPANDTNLTLTLAYANNGTAGSLEDEGGSALAAISAFSLSDAAAPLRIAQAYKDTNSNGVVDRIDVTFTEAITVASCEVGDYSIGGADAGTIAVSACAVSGADARFTISNAAQYDTNLALTFAYSQTNETANSLTDSAGNAVATLSATSVSDSAAPLLRTDEGNEPQYEDSNTNGQIDRVKLNFTETVTISYADEDWTATANNLTSFDVSAVSSGNTSATVYLTASAAANLTGVGAGTEPTLAFAATGGSIADASANTLDAFNAAALSDAASPLVTTISPADGDVSVNQTADVSMTFTETVDTGTVTYTFSVAPANITETWSNSNKTLTLSHAGFLSGTKTFTITAAEDTDGNTFAGAVALVTHPVTFTVKSDARRRQDPEGPGDPDITSFVVYKSPGSEELLQEITPGQVIAFAWQTTSDVGVYFILDVSSDSGETYTRIMDPIVHKRAYNWEVPLGAQSLKFRLTATDLSRTYEAVESEAYTVAQQQEIEEEIVEEPRDPNEIQAIQDGVGSEVYLFFQNERRVFINEITYRTWFTSFSEIKHVDLLTLSQYPLVGVALPRSGRALVKLPTSPEVYYLEENPLRIFTPRLRWIPNEENARAWFGEDWAGYVVDIEPTFFTKFEKGAPLSEEDAQAIDTSLLIRRE